MSDSYLEIKNVDFTIGGKIKVKNASFVIENEGDTLCILGPSGIGKTTILRTIAVHLKAKDQVELITILQVKLFVLPLR